MKRYGGAESVDVIVPIYKGQHYIDGIISQLEACLARMRRDFRVGLILVNDDPEDVFQRDYVSETIDVVVAETDQNRGIHGARVRGLSYCTGDYVVFLDQDDRLSENYFQSQLDALGSADAVICKALNGIREFYDCDRRFEEAVSIHHMFSVGNGILSPGQVLMRRKAVSRFWMENILRHNGADDWMLWLCMMYEGSRFACNGDLLYEHVLGDNNCSQSIFGMYQSEREMYRVLQDQNYFDTGYFVQLRQAMQRGMEIRLKEQDRLKTIVGVYDAWLAAGYSSVVNALKHAGFHKVAIYGMGKIGLRLYQEIRGGVEVKCFIDRNAAYIKNDMPVYTLEQDIPPVDFVIITLTDREKRILNEVSSKLQVPAKNIQDLILTL